MPATKRLLHLLVLIRLVLPFLLQHPSWQPHRDEFLYLDYADHMDWGYMEVPPLLSVFSWLVQHLGHSIFWIKLFPALAGAATFLMCGSIVIHAGGNRLSIWLLFLGFCFSAFLRLFHLFQPGFLEVLSWTSISYCLIRYEQTQKEKWLWLFGVACGLGMLSKYTTAFFLTGLVAGLALSSKRDILFKKHFWLASLLAFLFFLPNLWWQYMHRFPVVHHMQELRDTQLQFVSPVEFLVDQLIMFLPVLIIWMGGLFAAAFSSWAKPYRWIAIQYVVVIMLLIGGSGKGYYALGLYPMLLALGSVHLGKWLQKKTEMVKWAVIAICVIPGLLILPLALPTFPAAQQAAFYQKMGVSNSPLFRWEDRKMHALPQDFADMIGWEEIAAMTAKHFNALPDSIRHNTMIYCRGYHTAGLLNWYGKQYNLPTAYSDNGSYLLWMPEKYHFKHLMMIGWRMPDADDEVFNHFANREVLDSLQLPLAREHGIKLFLFSHADSVMTTLVAKGIAEEKARFAR
jgi:hypothetical protein